MTMPRVMTVAGSDSGGGAGIQADIKTITALGAFATSAITALTAQNTTGVTGIEPVPVPFIRSQIDAILDDIGTDAAKTGMLANAEVIDCVAEAFARHAVPNYVLDPVMVSKSGAVLLDEEAVDVMVRRLFPLATLVTPNVPEAERVTGVTVSDEAGAREAARRLARTGPRAVLVKGGHLEAEACIDVLFDGTRFHRFSGPRIPGKHTHGTGCTLSAAVAAFVAMGHELPRAVDLARRFVRAGIEEAPGLGRGWGPLNHLAAARKLSVNPEEAR